MKSKKIKPQYFSDYCNVSKAKLKELGTFNPILNIDTKLFVDPILLKDSLSKTIRNSISTFNKFFSDLLILLQYSKSKDDKCYRQARRIVNFPEYKYTCIGYGHNSTDGNGSGTELNDKIYKVQKKLLNLEKKILIFFCYYLY
ncbi:MAG TPA: hypothetical protein VLL98_05475 [Rickettsiales bacterium]|nr:hypothetical protein [Rickettsiales bacterium]